METEVQAVSEVNIDLVRRFPLRPIRDDAGLARAVAAMRRLVVRDDLTPEEDDCLFVLGSLIHDYEEAHDPVTSDSVEGDDRNETV